MYGIIPNAKIAIRLTAPPAKTLNIPNKPFWFPSIINCNCSGSIPGKGTNVPNLYIVRMNIVNNILFLRSPDCGVTLIFCRYFFLIRIDPPIFSNFSLADFEIKSASILILTLISPVPKILSF